MPISRNIQSNGSLEAAFLPTLLVATLVLDAVFPSSSQDVEPTTFLKCLEDKTLCKRAWNRSGFRSKGKCVT